MTQCKVSYNPSDSWQEAVLIVVIWLWREWQCYVGCRTKRSGSGTGIFFLPSVLKKGRNWEHSWHRVFLPVGSWGGIPNFGSQIVAFTEFSISSDEFPSPAVNFMRNQENVMMMTMSVVVTRSGAPPLFLPGSFKREASKGNHRGIKFTWRRTIGNFVRWLFSSLALHVNSVLQKDTTPFHCDRYDTAFTNHSEKALVYPYR